MTANEFLSRFNARCRETGIQNSPTALVNALARHVADALEEISGGGAKKKAGPSHREILEAMDKDELQAIVDERGIEVEGTGAGGNVLKRDLVEALS